MKFDDLLKHLGEFGSYQKRQYILVCLPKVLTGLQMVISVFIAAVPTHRCQIPSWDNDTYTVQNQVHQLHINTTIPWTRNSQGVVKYDKCERYVVIGNETVHRNTSREECSSWVYDKSIFQSTIVTKLDLVCDKKAYRSHAQMIFMGGVLIGSIVFGILADMLGRKTCICAALVLQTTSGIATAFAPEFYSFALLRLLNGSANAALMINSFVLATEIVGPTRRRWTGVLLMPFFTLGYMLLAGLSYLIRDWRYLQIACSAPGALLFFYWCFLPESPRWLFATGRTEKGKEIIHRMAKINKVSLTDKMVENVTLGTPVKTEKFTKIFTSRVLVVRAGISFFNWLVVSMIYYGLSLNSGNLVGNMHLNFFLSGLVELPAYAGLMWALNNTGRRYLISSAMIIGGLACVSTLFPVLYARDTLQWITLVLALMGKFCATIAFAMVYVMTSEIFPTVIRNGAVGGGSMCARIGGMIAPYISDLGDYVGGDFGQAVPLVTFGASALLAGSLSLLLPETFNRRLPESIEDGIKFGRNEKNGTKEKSVYDNVIVVEEDGF